MMAAKTEVVVHDTKADPVTGRIELHLKCRNTEGTATWDGPVKQYSADPQTIRDRFNGSIDDFAAWAAKEHQACVGLKPGVVEDLQARKGSTIG